MTQCHELKESTVGAINDRPYGRFLKFPTLVSHLTRLGVMFLQAMLLLPDTNVTRMTSGRLLNRKGNTLLPRPRLTTMLVAFSV